MNFSTKLPAGWTYADFLAAKNETNDMEICIVNAQNGVMSCPWSQDGDAAWRIAFTDFALLGDYPDGETTFPNAKAWL